MRTLRTANFLPNHLGFWWGSVHQSSFESDSLRVGGIFALYINDDVLDHRNLVRHYRIVAMAMAPESYLSIIAFSVTEEDLPKNGQIIPFISPSMLVDSIPYFN